MSLGQLHAAEEVLDLGRIHITITPVIWIAFAADASWRLLGGKRAVASIIRVLIIWFPEPGDYLFIRQNITLCGMKDPALPSYLCRPLSALQVAELPLKEKINFHLEPW